MMRVGVTTASQQPYTVFAPPRSSSANSRASRDHPSNLNLFSSGLHNLPRLSFRCNCAGDSGENESKTILDAFFMGKAVAEALNERIESAVGEFLSTIGRLQAEQQKQVQEFQEEVLEKARRAKEQAAREAMEAQGLVPKSTVVENISSVNGVAVNASSVSDPVPTADSSLESKPTTEDPPNDD
ncbi:uncharacterized protein at4g13200 chloroplastic [Phtheirospermum japonicum]|uniref:Uncharacterized protein at4g13200 chloroplastic n=1 Tax=Phtheirospermum japonicum TaxID=374723 RepID=A0A830DN66_9LAMI|nr:uncharacterized protein at4g13200 chloroplastic [Phtheirospermum japonicum]